MGADLLGYSVVLPVGKEAERVVKSYLGKLQRIISAHGDSAVIARRRIIERGNPWLTPDGVDRLARTYVSRAGVAALDKAGVPTGYIADTAGIPEDGDDEIIDAVGGYLEQLNGFRTDGLTYRDCVMRCDKIVGQKVVLVFAGAPSWGDEPDGVGYQTLKAAAMTGLIEKLEARVKGLGDRPSRKR